MDTNCVCHLERAVNFVLFSRNQYIVPDLEKSEFMKMFCDYTKLLLTLDCLIH